jgi:hypothetical protein
MSYQTFGEILGPRAGDGGVVTSGEGGKTPLRVGKVVGDGNSTRCGDCQRSAFPGGIRRAVRYDHGAG